MLPFRRIIFPIDYSESCRAVAPHVAEMARRFSAEVRLLHAAEPASPGEREEERLRDYARDLFPSLDFACTIGRGDPADAIHEAVQEHSADLVMMPTRGQGRLRRLLLGSVTAKVLHDLSCAVWTSTQEAESGHMQCRSLLAAVGADDEALPVLTAAASLVRSFEAALSIVHVVETPPASFEMDFAPFRKQLMDSADLMIRGLMSAHKIEGAFAVRDGDLAATLRQEAFDRSADLVILGRGHAQGRVSRLWSHLYEVVRGGALPSAQYLKARRTGLPACCDGPSVRESA